MIDQRTLASRRFIQAHFHDLDFTCFPTHFTGVEAINKPFMFDMEMRVPNGYVDRESLMGQSVDVRLGKDKASRVFNGLVFKCSQHDSYRNSSYRDYDHYRITLVPWLYYLGLTNNCRIFQNKSPLEIFKEICRSYGYLSIDTGMLTKRYDPIAYCTQYNESDADFIDRLFQKYGISYVFTHEAGQHTMFLFDYIGACPSCDENVIFNHKLKATQALHEWKQNNRWSTNRYTLADYDPTQASLSLSATNQSKQGLEVLTASKYEHFEYPGRFDTNAAGSIQAQQKTDSHAYLTQFVEAASNNLSLKPGSPFTLTQHPDVDPQGKYFITTLKHQARDYTGLPFAHDQPSEQHYVNDLTCFSTKLAYAPLTIVPWPEIMGPQTAVVVGTEEESAYPDKYARVKVQFNWDRQGEYTSACSRWIRVGQGYGGGTHGMQALPRKGSIVLVDFVEGDPDRPQIAGMLPGPNDTLPFSPEERPNTSGIKTRTPGGQAGAYNEFSFDDSPGRQNINIQAQNSMNISVKGDARSTVTGDMTHNIEGDHTHSAHDSIIYSAKDKMTLHVGDTKVEMEPRKMTITTFRFATGMPPEAAEPLPEKVPTFTSAPGSEQTADTQSPQSPTSTAPKQLAFMLDMPGVKGTFAASVDQVNSVALSSGSQKLYPLKPTQYSGDVHIEYNGHSYCVGHTEQLRFNQDNIAPIYIGQRIKKAASQKAFEQQQENAYNDQIENLFMVKAMSAGPASLTDGAYNTDKANDGILAWLAAQLNNPAKKEALNTASEALTMAVRNRQFLEDFMHGGKFYIKTVNDSRYVIFKGAAGSRKYIKGIRYRADNPKLKILNIITKPGEDDPAGFLSKLGGKAVDFAKESILGIALVSAEDVLQYYLTPENQRSLTDLVTSIGLDLGNYMVSKMLAGVIVGAAIAALPAEIAVGSVFLIIAFGLVFSAGVNWALDEIEEDLGIRKEVQKLAQECVAFLKPYWPQMFNSLTLVDSAPLHGDAF